MAIVTISTVYIIITTIFTLHQISDITRSLYTLLALPDAFSGVAAVRRLSLVGHNVLESRHLTFDFVEVVDIFFLAHTLSTLITHF